MRKIIFGFIFVFAFSFSVSAQNNQARKVDEFANIPCDEYLARINALVQELKNLPDSKGYIFVYEGKESRQVYDKNNKYTGEKYISPQFGLARNVIKKIGMRLKLQGSDIKRFIFINGGFREKFTVEFWIVPNGVIPPKPAPTLEKMKYRKGKPNGFCIFFP